MKMAGMTRRSSLGNSQIHKTQDSLDRLRRLYPAVIDPENTLPRSWSPKDKHNFIGLTQNDLRVHYKGVLSPHDQNAQGVGKTHKDAASVRATQPIPAACGIYYFEIKIISKGRDGYMGIGLSAQGINMNRLPGWDKMTYGYHGDDGHSFCSSGTGQPYGPTFTTGDVIGCCVNLIDCTCFYTKNGISLGIAFRDLPSYLYPTVGLQTPGEVIEANFGQSPFVYDIEDYIKEWHMKTRQTVERFPIPERMGEWQTMLHKIVSTYLVHHGYCATAESFARNTDQGFEEELKSIKNRQRIQKLVLAGRMGEAIETTQQLYPGLLERDTNLLFMLKCRQFIEMVNGTDSEVRGTAIHSPKSHHGSSNSGTGSNRSTPSVSPMHYSASMPVGTSSQHVVPPVRCSSPSGHIITKGHSASHISTQQNAAIDLRTISEEEMNLTNCVRNGDGDTANGANVRLEDIDVDMDTSESISDERTISSNGTMNGACTNGTSVEGSHQDDMEVDPPVSRRQLCGGIPAAVQKMLQFGRQLHSMGEQLKREFGTNNANKKALLDAFSLLAYADPWSSPVGHQLDPVEREPVCAALNSAILESHGLPKQPPLELAIGQASACMQLMSKANIGSCAFISVNTYLQH